jgi:hypothetical protein
MCSLRHLAQARLLHDSRQEQQVSDLRNIHGVRVFVCAADGPKLASEHDATDFISAAIEQQAALVAIPVARLSDDFFRLSTRLAGEVVQKFVNYNVQLAIIGDLSIWTAASNALRDFVREANRGQAIWFVDDQHELERRLTPQP